MKKSWSRRTAVALPLILLVGWGDAALGQQAAPMCKPSVTFTPHKDRDLMCYKSGSKCICKPANFTRGGWPMTVVDPGEPGWNYREINERFLDELHNRLLNADSKERGQISRDIREVSKLIERQNGN